uniref:Phospholipid/glycerol acyltransferase domain-containing protein n=1 Tax=Chromera velia CCMP2878 TaxID=1169474 RepID=A0A0G4IBX0_9ALVE|eukprot:Cvel_12962.t1-p1 / transcript=Cvel_12962.t1 / gene=Cvel_12962 / organism=Chromera_velia_CCMP2878 / gene_product=Lysophospholipid acyltransferase LPEAT1, putative / transcript_product=Lysophospholipid acyltransferase LPEAT1, putative / location=Cvel_scaffold867:61403-63179(+) / protein_length=418 / sequence_SO=supercontig / SO=protein_coding / is_pseudo=false
MRCFVQICTRSLLFVSGFYWIHVRRIKEKQPSWGEEDEEGGESLEEGTLSGSRKSRAKKRKFRLRRERPNVIVCNHPGGFDVPLLFLFFPNRFVAKAQFASAPFLGTIAKAFGCIFVLRESSEARRLVRESVSSIAKGEELGRWTLPLNMFPEGTTTNGRSLIRFQSGAFVAGAPVQPVVIQFPWCVFNPCWAAIGGGELFLRILFQVYGCATITILPPYYPSEAEKQDPILYATGVRAEMAKLGGMSELDVDFRDGLQWWSEYLRERKHKDVESPTIEKSVRRVADSGQVRERLRESLEMNTHLQEGGNRATGTEAVGEVRERTDTSPPVSSSPQTALLANQEREKGEAMQAVCSDQAGEVYDAGEEGNAQSHARTLSGMRDAIEEQETGEEKALREKNDWVVRETMILSIDASPPD